MIFPSVDLSTNLSAIKDTCEFASRFLLEGGFLVLFIKQHQIAAAAGLIAKHCNGLESLGLVQCYFDPQWLNKPMPYVDSCAATYLIYWKKSAEDESELLPFDSNNYSTVYAQ